MNYDLYCKKLENKIANKENQLSQKKDEAQRIVQRYHYFKKRKNLNDQSKRNCWEMAKLAVPIDASVTTRNEIIAKNKREATMATGRQTMIENDAKMVQEYRQRLQNSKNEIAKLESELEGLKDQLKLKRVTKMGEAKLVDINKSTVDECILGSQFYAVLRQVMRVISNPNECCDQSIPYANNSHKSKLDKANREVEKLANYLVQYFGGSDMKVQPCSSINEAFPKDYTVVFKYKGQRLSIGLNIMQASSSLQINICPKDRSKCFTCEFPLVSKTRD